jgi:hypothetical protein
MEWWSDGVLKFADKTDGHIILNNSICKFIIKTLKR